MTAPTRIFDFLQWQLEHMPRPDAICAKRDGKWIKYSIQEVIAQVDAIARGLLKLGLKKGDKISIVSDNCPEWNFVDLAALQIGAVTVPIYPTLTAENYKYIIEHSDSKLVFAQNQEYYDKANSKRAEIEGLLEIFTFQKVAGARHYAELAVQDTSIDLAPHKADVAASDLATIVYTSGTTGLPKGVMLSHSNIVSNVIDVSTCGLLPGEEVILNESEFRAISFLPISHVFERVVIYAYLFRLIPIYYAQSIETIADDIKDVRPFMFSAVPRLLEKVYEKIQVKILEKPKPVQKLAYWAIDLVKDYDPQKSYGLGYKLKLAIARKLVFSKWKEALGGRIGLIVTGASKLNPDIMHVFWGAGIPILEAYGMSESSPAITANRLLGNNVRIGSVGKAIPNVEVEIRQEPGYPDGEGEIVARGPNIMMGYYKMPEETAKTIDTQGWLHTGDIGRFDKDGFLFVTDRKKEMFKTSQGKYIAPQHVENKMKASTFIEQIMVVGENQKYCGAVIVPAFENLKNWAKENGVTFANHEELIAHPKVIAHLQTEVDRINKSLDRHEQVKQFQLLPKEWTIEAGELTPTMKVKRRIVMDKYKSRIAKIFEAA